MEPKYSLDVIKHIILFMTPKKLLRTALLYRKISTDDPFWIHQIKTRFGIYRKSKVSPLQQYYNLTFKTEFLAQTINTWREDTSKVLDLSNLGLQSWPSQLKGYENKVKILKINGNKLLRLPPLTRCVELMCYDNILLSLPLLPKCKRLLAMNNRLTQIEDLPECQYLDCSDNNISSVYRCPVLESFYCYNLEKPQKLRIDSKPEYSSHKGSSITHSYDDYINVVIVNYISEASV